MTLPIVRIVSQFFQGKEAQATQRRREQLVLAYRTEHVLGHAMLDAQSPRKQSKRLFSLCHNLQNISVEIDDLADLEPPSGPWADRERADCQIHCNRMESLLCNALAEVRILAVRFRVPVDVRVISAKMLEPPTHNIRGRIASST